MMWPLAKMFLGARAGVDPKNPSAANSPRRRGINPQSADCGAAPPCCCPSCCAFPEQFPTKGQQKKSFEIKSEEMVAEMSHVSVPWKIQEYILFRLKQILVAPLMVGQ